MRGAVLIGFVLASLSATAVAQSPAPTSGTLADAELRAVLEAAKEVAKATRENADYARVVPDILTQILAKLDKIENKLDKVENAVKASSGTRRGGR